MKEIRIGLREKFARGTLMWVYANDNKVYHSSKRFDTASFSDHNSNYLGEVEKVCANNKRQLSLINSMLKRSNRIYGICLNKKGEEAIRNNESPMGDEVLFFSTWEKMLEFANSHFKQTDKIQAEMKRREKARLNWLKRGQKYIKKKNTTAKEA